MMIIGCDFHPRFQQIAYVDGETGEFFERRLSHPEEAERFYRSLAGTQVRIGLSSAVPAGLSLEILVLTHALKAWFASARCGMAEAVPFVLSFSADGEKGTGLSFSCAVHRKPVSRPNAL
jgi:hypothetical protein